MDVLGPQDRFDTHFLDSPGVATRPRRGDHRHRNAITMSFFRTAGTGQDPATRVPSPQDHRNFREVAGSRHARPGDFMEVAVILDVEA